MDIDVWNRHYKVGTSIRYWKNNDKRGPGFLTKTRSLAMLLHGIPVVYVQGVPHALAIQQIAIANEIRRTIVDPKKAERLFS